MCVCVCTGDDAKHGSEGRAGGGRVFEVALEQETVRRDPRDNLPQPTRQPARCAGQGHGAGGRDRLKALWRT